jgi:hypothetical protein
VPLQEAIAADQAVPLPTDTCADCGFERRDHAETAPPAEGTIVTGYAVEDGEVVARDTVIPQGQPTLPGVEPAAYEQGLLPDVDGIKVLDLEIRFGGKYVLSGGQSDRRLAEILRLKKRVEFHGYAKVSDKGFKAKDDEPGLTAFAKLSVYGLSLSPFEPCDGEAEAELRINRRIAQAILAQEPGEERDAAMQRYLEEVVASIDPGAEAEEQVAEFADLPDDGDEEPSALDESLAEALAP